MNYKMMTYLNQYKLVEIIVCIQKCCLFADCYLHQIKSTQTSPVCSTLDVAPKPLQNVCCKMLECQQPKMKVIDSQWMLRRKKTVHRMLRYQDIILNIGFRFSSLKFFLVSTFLVLLCGTFFIRILL